MLKFFFINCLFVISYSTAQALPFLCEKQFPESLQVSTIETCNDQPWVMSHFDLVNKKDIDLSLVAQSTHKNNLGGSLIHFPSGDKIIYRSDILASDPFCLKALVETGKVTTIVNLYNKDDSNTTLLRAIEQNEFSALGGLIYYQVLNFHKVMDKANDGLTPQLTKVIASIVKQINQLPSPILVHCDSGQHLTGIIFGVVQKCYNKLPLDMIKHNMQCHILDSSSYGKFWSKKVFGFIEQFPCSALNEK